MVEPVSVHWCSEENALERKRVGTVAKGVIPLGRGMHIRIHRWGNYPTILCPRRTVLSWASIRQATDFYMVISLPYKKVIEY